MDEIRKQLSELIRTAEVFDSLVGSYIDDQKDNNGVLPKDAIRDCNRCYLELTNKFADVRNATRSVLSAEAKKQNNDVNHLRKCL